VDQRRRARASAWGSPEEYERRFWRIATIAQVRLGERERSTQKAAVRAAADACMAALPTTKGRLNDDEAAMIRHVEGFADAVEGACAAFPCLEPEEARGVARLEDIRAFLEPELNAKQSKRADSALERVERAMSAGSAEEAAANRAKMQLLIRYAPRSAVTCILHEGGGEEEEEEPAAGKGKSEEGARSAAAGTAVAEAAPVEAASAEAAPAVAAQGAEEQTSIRSDPAEADPADPAEAAAAEGAPAFAPRSPRTLAWTSGVDAFEEWTDLDEAVHRVGGRVERVPAEAHPFYGAYLEMKERVMDEAADAVALDPDRESREAAAEAALSLFGSGIVPPPATGSGATAARLLAAGAKAEGPSPDPALHAPSPSASDPRAPAIVVDPKDDPDGVLRWALANRKKAPRLKRVIRKKVMLSVRSMVAAKKSRALKGWLESSGLGPLLLEAALRREGVRDVEALVRILERSERPGAPPPADPAAAAAAALAPLCAALQLDPAEAAQLAAAAAETRAADVAAAAEEARRRAEAEAKARAEAEAAAAKAKAEEEVARARRQASRKAALSASEECAKDGRDAAWIARAARRAALRAMEGATPAEAAEAAVTAAGEASGRLCEVLSRHLVSWFTGTSALEEEREKELRFGWLRAELARRGITGGRLVKLMDDSEDREIDAREFATGMKKAGISVQKDGSGAASDCDYEDLYKLFDADGDGTIQWKEMAAGLTGETGTDAGASASRRILIEIDGALARARMLDRRWRNAKTSSKLVKARKGLAAAVKHQHSSSTLRKLDSAAGATSSAADMLAGVSLSDPAKELAKAREASQRATAAAKADGARAAEAAAARETAALLRSATAATETMRQERKGLLNDDEKGVVEDAVAFAAKHRSQASRAAFLEADADGDGQPEDEAATFYVHLTAEHVRTALSPLREFLKKELNKSQMQQVEAAFAALEAACVDAEVETQRALESSARDAGFSAKAEVHAAFEAARKEKEEEDKRKKREKSAKLAKEKAEFWGDGGAKKVEAETQEADKLRAEEAGDDGEVARKPKEEEDAPDEEKEGEADQGLVDASDAAERKKKMALAAFG
jgi:hypothetical protein